MFSFEKKLRKGETKDCDVVDIIYKCMCAAVRISTKFSSSWNLSGKSLAINICSVFYSFTVGSVLSHNDDQPCDCLKALQL